ncbi:sigma-54-dependent Fis family transcriptional regulator, partial [Candidatus Dependentiae bacterium]|nr:sigma-54-dependent Fis family transcriptional regulator [Candidatus Dependentiae bacterium]
MKKKILVIDDDESVCSFLNDLLGKDYSVISYTNPKKALDFLDNEMTDIVILDIRMPDISGEEVLKLIKNKFDRLPVIMVTAIDDLKTAVRCIKSGAYEYLTKPFHIDEIRYTIKQALYVEDIENQLEYLKSNSIEKHSFELKTKSPKMAEIMNTVHKVAKQNVTILLMGESGVGKEVMANYIHNISKGKDNPFIAIDCGAIPPTLIQSELFGYERGAFTGAAGSKKGKIELANNGTLFLDEINNMDLDSQAKLLRVIQTKKIERLGSSAAIDIDARFIVASNKNLWDEVENKRFREDLYYRINVIPIVLPPLRERFEDIEIISNQIIEKMNKKNKKNIMHASEEIIELFK